MLLIEKYKQIINIIDNLDIQCNSNNMCVEVGKGWTKFLKTQLFYGN